MKAEKILFDGKTVRNFYDDRPYYNVKIKFLQRFLYRSSYYFELKNR